MTTNPERLWRECLGGDLRACSEMMEIARRENDYEKMLEVVVLWLKGILQRYYDARVGHRLTPFADWMRSRDAVRRMALVTAWLGIEKDWSGDLLSAAYRYFHEWLKGDPSYFISRDYRKKPDPGVLLGVAAGVFKVDVRGYVFPGPEFPRLDPSPAGVPEARSE